ncbi:MAG: metal-dependent hydrolase [Acidimicrobiales bacterium]
MLGRDHALTGACAFMALSPVLHTAIHALPSTPVPIGVGAVASGAFALLPDIDEPGSAVSRKLGPLSRAVSKVTDRGPSSASTSPGYRSLSPAASSGTWSATP